MNYTGKWVVVTGVRDVAARGHRIATNVMQGVVRQDPLGIIFGGARGIDTITLTAAGLERKRLADQPGRSVLAPKLVVVVPASVAQQTVIARNAIREYADEVIELGLDLTRGSSYHTRNGKMITEGRLRDPEERPVVIAFPDAAVGSKEGGTAATMKLARGWGLDVEVFPVPVTPGGVD